MKLKTSTFITVLVVIVSAIFIAGCGGEPEAAAPDYTQSSGSGGDGALVGDGGVTGEEAEPNPSLPLLKGGGIRGGMKSSSDRFVFEVIGAAKTDGTDGGQNGMDGAMPGGMGDSTFPTPDGNYGQNQFPEMPNPSESEPAEPDAPIFSGARISVNGKVHVVFIGGTFPKADQAFRLVSVTKDEIEIELVAGEFTTDGSSGVFLNRGDLVSLVNSSMGVTYKIKYIRPTKDNAQLSL